MDYEDDSDSERLAYFLRCTNFNDIDDAIESFTLDLKQDSTQSVTQDGTQSVTQDGAQSVTQVGTQNVTQDGTQNVKPSASQNVREIKPLLKDQNKIFCFFIYNYKYKFLPQLRSKLNETISDELSESYSKEIAGTIEDYYLRYNVEREMTDEMRAINQPKYDGHDWPAIWLYTSTPNDTPETKLFHKFMVPGKIMKLQDNLQLGLIAYHVLFRELQLVIRMYPELGMSEGTLYRFELWDDKKLQYYQKELQTRPVIEREYKEKVLLFSTTRKIRTANDFYQKYKSKKKPDDKLTPCLLTYEIVPVDVDFLAHFRKLFPHIPVWENCSVNISRFSVYKAEDEILACDASSKKIYEIEENGDLCNVKIAMTNIAAMFEDEKYFRKKEEYIYNAISKEAILQHLAKWDSEQFQAEANLLKRKLNEFFNRVEIHIDILVRTGFDLSKATKLAVERIWQKYSFFNFMVRREDEVLYRNIARLEKNVPHLLAGCKTDFSGSIGPIITQLINILRDCLSGGDVDKLSERIWQCYQNFVALTKGEMSECSKDDLPTPANIMIEITDCFVEYGEFVETKSERAFYEHLFDCAMKITENCMKEAGEYEEYRERIESTVPRFRTRAVDYLLNADNKIKNNPSNIIGDHLQYYDAFNLVLSSGLPIPVAPVSSTSIEWNEELSNVYKNTKIKTTESLDHMKDGTLNRYKEQGIPDCQGQFSNLLSAIYPIDSVNDIAKEGVDTITKSPPKLSSDWQDPIFIFSGDEYSSYLNQIESYGQDMDIGGTVQRTVLSLFASCLLNLYSHRNLEWGQFEFMVNLDME